MIGRSGGRNDKASRLIPRRPLRRRPWTSLGEILATFRLTGGVASAMFSPMRCPFCHKDNDRVIDSRASQDGLAIRRRRECVACNRRYTTYERAEETPIKVIKKDGSRAPFDRDKILRGLERACWKRPISTRQIENTVTSIESDVYRKFDTEVESSELGELVMDHLRSLDEVAFVRFASVYRQFKDAQDFVEELRPILEGAARKTPR